MLRSFKNKYFIKISGLIHIGGHYGQEYQIYESLGIKNLMFFEPVPSTFKILESNLNGKAILVNKALGNKNKKVIMNVENANQGMSSSILEPHLHLQRYPDIIFNDKIEVDMVRLDDFMANMPKIYNFIVLDVQGYELEVLKGASDILKSIDYIISEVNKEELYKDLPLVEDLDRFLKGYSRVETAWSDYGWGDALYVKKNKLLTYL